MKTPTLFKCEKCDATTPRYNAAGWLIASRKNDPKAAPGQMFIRCPEHVTEYARNRAKKYS